MGPADGRFRPLRLDDRPPLRDGRAAAWLSRNQDDAANGPLSEAQACGERGRSAAEPVLIMRSRALTPTPLPQAGEGLSLLPLAGEGGRAKRGRMRAFYPAACETSAASRVGFGSPSNPQATRASIICGGAGASTSIGGFVFDSGTTTLRARSCSGVSARAP